MPNWSVIPAPDMERYFTLTLDALLVLTGCLCLHTCAGESIIQTLPVVAVSEGEDAILECNVTKDGNLVFPCSETRSDIQWLRLWNNTEIASCSRVDRWARFDHLTNALTIPNVQLSANGSVYVCTVFSASTDVLDSTTKLLVEKRVFTVVTAPLVYARIREEVTLVCSVLYTYTPEDRDLTCQWFLDNEFLSAACTNGEQSTAGKHFFHCNSQSCNLTVRHLELSDEGRYECRVHAASKTASNESVLIVQVPPEAVFITNTSTGEVLQGDVRLQPNGSYNFTCLATHTRPPAVITWAWDGGEVGASVLPGEAAVVGAAGLSNVSGVFSVSTLTSTRGTLTCRAESAGKVAWSTLTLILADDRKTIPTTLHTSVTESSDTADERSPILVVYIVPFAAGTLLIALLFLGVGLWKHRQRDFTAVINPSSVQVRFRRIRNDIPTASVRPVLGVASLPNQDHCNIYEETPVLMMPSRSRQPATTPSIDDIGENETPHHGNVRREGIANISNRHRENVGANVPGSSSDQSTERSTEKVRIDSAEELIYADLQLTTTHPIHAPPIRTVPRTPYADIQLLGLPWNPPEFSDGEGGAEGMEEREEATVDTEGEEEAPPPPRRGNSATSPLAIDWEL